MICEVESLLFWDLETEVGLSTEFNFCFLVYRRKIPNSPITNFKLQIADRERSDLRNLQVTSAPSVPLCG
jgi:hypothetical protein